VLLTFVVSCNPDVMAACLDGGHASGTWLAECADYLARDAGQIWEFVLFSRVINGVSKVHQACGTIVSRR